MGEWNIAPSFLTSALDEGEWSASRLGHFTPGESAPVLIAEEAGWAPESVCMLWSTEKS
jgi:hypothetical protein